MRAKVVSDFVMLRIVARNAVECGNLFPPSLKRLVAQSFGCTGAVATALCVTSPAGHGWNKFQHSTARCALLSINNN